MSRREDRLWLNFFSSVRSKDQSSQGYHPQFGAYLQYSYLCVVSQYTFELLFFRKSKVTFLPLQVYPGRAVVTSWLVDSIQSRISVLALVSFHHLDALLEHNYVSSFFT